MGYYWILIFVLLLILLLIYIKNRQNNVTYVQSDIDNNYYLVRDLADKQHASNLLAKIKQNIETLTKHVYENKDSKYAEYKPYIEQLSQRIQNVIILESSGDGVYTSYSVNKGEQIVFCLRSRKIKNQLHKLNLLMYVVIHEMAHVACPEYGHTALFKKIFAFLAQVATEIGIYEKIDFSKNPEEYCGLMLTDSII
jgi:predicted metal-dependent hydrolase